MTSQPLLPNPCLPIGTLAISSLQQRLKVGMGSSFPRGGPFLGLGVPGLGSRPQEPEESQGEAACEASSLSPMHGGLPAHDSTFRGRSSGNSLPGAAFPDLVGVDLAPQGFSSHASAAFPALARTGLPGVAGFLRGPMVHQQQPDSARPVGTQEAAPGQRLVPEEEYRALSLQHEQLLLQHQQLLQLQLLQQQEQLLQAALAANEGTNQLLNLNQTLDPNMLGVPSAAAAGLGTGSAAEVAAAQTTMAAGQLATGAAAWLAQDQALGAGSRGGAMAAGQRPSVLAVSREAPSSGFPPPIDSTLELAQHEPPLLHAFHGRSAGMLPPHAPPPGGEAPASMGSPAVASQRASKSPPSATPAQDNPQRSGLLGRYGSVAAGGEMPAPPYPRSRTSAGRASASQQSPKATWAGREHAESGSKSGIGFSQWMTRLHSVDDRSVDSSAAGDHPHRESTMRDTEHSPEESRREESRRRKSFSDAVSCLGSRKKGREERGRGFLGRSPWQEEVGEVSEEREGSQVEEEEEVGMDSTLGRPALNLNALGTIDPDPGGFSGGAMQSVQPMTETPAQGLRQSTAAGAGTGGAMYSGWCVVGGPVHPLQAEWQDQKEELRREDQRKDATPSNLLSRPSPSLAEPRLGLQLGLSPVKDSRHGSAAEDFLGMGTRQASAAGMARAAWGGIDAGMDVGMEVGLDVGMEVRGDSGAHLMGQVVATDEQLLTAASDLAVSHQALAPGAGGDLASAFTHAQTGLGSRGVGSGVLGRGPDFFRVSEELSAGPGQPMALGERALAAAALAGASGAGSIFPDMKPLQGIGAGASALVTHDRYWAREGYPTSPREVSPRPPVSNFDAWKRDLMSGASGMDTTEDGLRERRDLAESLSATASREERDREKGSVGFGPVAPQRPAYLGERPAYKILHGTRWSPHFDPSARGAVRASSVDRGRPGLVDREHEGEGSGDNGLAASPSQHPGFGGALGIGTNRYFFGGMPETREREAGGESVGGFDGEDEESAEREERAKQIRRSLMREATNMTWPRRADGLGDHLWMGPGMGPEQQGNGGL